MATRPAGIIAAAATPLHADFSVDTRRLVAHLRRLLAIGCDGINLLGTTGEATSLPVAARVQTMRAVADAGLPVGRFLVGTGAAAMADAVTLTRAACDCGFGGALMLPPFYYKGIDTPGLVAYVSEVVQRVDDPKLALYLYHYPVLSGVPWSLATVVALKARFPRALRGLKDSSGDLAFAAQMARQIEDFDVFPSAEAALASADAALFAGCISATANVTAPLAGAGWHAVDTATRAARIGDAAAVRSAFTSLPLIAAVKDALADLYGDAEWKRVLPPLRELDAAESARLRAALATTPFDALRAQFA